MLTPGAEVHFFLSTQRKGLLQLWTYDLEKYLGKLSKANSVTFKATKVLFSGVTLALGHLDFITAVQTSRVTFSEVVTPRSSNYIILPPVKNVLI